MEFLDGFLPSHLLFTDMYSVFSHPKSVASNSPLQLQQFLLDYQVLLHMDYCSSFNDLYEGVENITITLADYTAKSQLHQ